MTTSTETQALIARLDRMEALLARVLIAVEGTRPAVAPVATPEPAAPLEPIAPNEPPRIRVAPPGTPAVRAAAAPLPAEPAPAPAPAEPARWSLSEGDGPPVPGPDAPIHAIVERLFEAALEPKAEDTWAILMRLFHSSQLVGPRALDHFKGFAWTRLRRNAKIYLPDGTPASFRIAYTDPLEPRGHEKEIRLFVKTVDDRMPVPLVLTRDPAAGGAWRVSNISL